MQQWIEAQQRELTFAESGGLRATGAARLSAACPLPAGGELPDARRCWQRRLHCCWEQPAETRALTSVSCSQKRQSSSVHAEAKYQLPASCSHMHTECCAQDCPHTHHPEAAARMLRHTHRPHKLHAGRGNRVNSSPCGGCSRSSPDSAPEPALLWAAHAHDAWRPDGTEPSRAAAEGAPEPPPKEALLMPACH